MKKVLVGVAMLSFLIGCSTTSSNMRIGNDQSYVSLKDQREAVLHVKEYADLPAGAQIIGKVDASRCHRYANQSKPSNTEVLIDLKVAAFAKGADGISGVKYENGSALTQNCWEVWNGEAVAFTIQK
ncbi:hypothetical protein [Comamonas testosteroni]|uniref:hypothetical protein n=1 Tax=Comamonas testosteroni TaxID=285 RepID=UPI00391C8446